MTVGVRIFQFQKVQFKGDGDLTAGEPLIYFNSKRYNSKSSPFSSAMRSNSISIPKGTIQSRNRNAVFDSGSIFQFQKVQFKAVRKYQRMTSIPISIPKGTIQSRKKGFLGL